MPNTDEITNSSFLVTDPVVEATIKRMQKVQVTQSLQPPDIQAILVFTITTVLI